MAAKEDVKAAEVAEESQGVKNLREVIDNMGGSLPPADRAKFEELLARAIASDAANAG